MVHLYSGGGVDAYGPALLVRKRCSTRSRSSGSYYMDAVSNASIDVVTTASPYHEIRHEFGLGADYVYRDAQITVGLTTSHEPDYTANAGNLDFTQEVFAGMTTISLGFTRGADTVLKTRLARVSRQGQPLAVPARCDPDPDPALAGQRELRGPLRRRLPRQPVSGCARLRHDRARSAIRARAPAAR